MSGCSHCPISPDLRCAGLDAHRFCELIDPRHDSYTPAYVRTLLGLAVRAPMAADPGSKAVEAVERLQALRAGPFRSIDSDCGCAGARCGLRQLGTVSYADCFECIRRYG